MEKKDLRAFVRAKKRAMTPAQVEAASARLAQQLFRHPAYQAARSLYGYLSYNQEVRTAAILRRAQQDGKRVAVPKVFGDEMKFLWLDAKFSSGCAKSMSIWMQAVFIRRTPSQPEAPAC